MQFCVLKTWSLKGIRVLVWSSLLGFLLWVIGLAIVIDVLIVFLVTLRCVYIVAIGNLTVGVLVAVMTGSFPGTSLGVRGVGAKQEAAILQLQLGQTHSLLFYCLKTCPKCVNEAGPWSQNPSCSQDPYHPERSSHIWQPGVPQSRILNNNPQPGLHIISWASSLLLSRPDKDISLVFICKLFWRLSLTAHITASCNRAQPAAIGLTRSRTGAQRWVLWLRWWLWLLLRSPMSVSPSSPLPGPKGWGSGYHPSLPALPPNWAAMAPFLSFSFHRCPFSPHPDPYIYMFIKALVFATPFYRYTS